jgi:hypothetical protein
MTEAITTVLSRAFDAQLETIEALISGHIANARAQGKNAVQLDISKINDPLGFRLRHDTDNALAEVISDMFTWNSFVRKYGRWLIAEYEGSNCILIDQDALLIHNVAD